MELELTTLPSRWTPAEHIGAAIGGGYLPHMGELWSTLEEHERKQASIESSRVHEREKDRLRGLLRADRDEKVRAATDVDISRAVRDLDQAIGRARAKAREGQKDNPHAQQLASLMAVVSAAIDATPIEAAFETALLTEDENTIRTIGALGTERLRGLAAEKAAPAAQKARQDRAFAFGQKFQQWEKAHPSIAVEIAELERQRGNIVLQLQSAASHYLARYGVTTATPVRGSLQVGRVFDGPRPTPRVPDASLIAVPKLKIGPAFDLLKRQRR